MATHLIKLTVGVETLDDFAHLLQQHVTHYNGTEANYVITRFMPKRAEEILETGGSIYRVINGMLCCRQPIIGFDYIETPQGKKCAIYTSTDLIRVEATKRRPFQGWRYLKPKDTPADIGPYETFDPDEYQDMKRELRELGLLT